MIRFTAFSLHAALVLTLAAPACSPEPEAAPPAAAEGAAAAPLPPIPNTVPDLPPGCTAIVIRLSGAPQIPDPFPPEGVRMRVKGNDTDAVVEVAPGDDLNSLTEKLARCFLADGWTLHLEPGDPPSLYLYLPPGPITMNFQMQAGIPGVSMSSGFGSPPQR